MHRVVALTKPVQSTFELGSAYEVFGSERPGVPRHYQLEVCTEKPGLVPTTAGYEIAVARGLEAIDAADTVIIPGWVPVEAELSTALRATLLRAHARGARLVTICSGVFALAGTGLLDGRAAATHWARADTLRAAFPAVDVRPGARFIDHGDVATSAGAGAGIDLLLHLVRKDLGEAHVRLLARHMAVAEDHDQSLSAHLDRSADDALVRTMVWAVARLEQVSGVGQLAAHMNVSPRTLARRFSQQIGTSPGAWLHERKVAEACRLLADTDLPVEAIARRVGLSSSVNLRRRFRQHVGTTPSAYRHASRTVRASRAAGADVQHFEPWDVTRGEWPAQPVPAVAPAAAVGSRDGLTSD